MFCLDYINTLKSSAHLIPFFQYSRNTQTPQGTFSLPPAKPNVKSSPASLLLENSLFSFTSHQRKEKIEPKKTLPKKPLGSVTAD